MCDRSFGKTFQETRGPAGARAGEAGRPVLEHALQFAAHRPELIDFAIQFLESRLRFGKGHSAGSAASITNMQNSSKFPQ
jgi:hypothetical protein